MGLGLFRERRPADARQDVGSSSWTSATSSSSVREPMSPSVRSRTPTLPSAASRSPTTSMNGTFCCCALAILMRIGSFVGVDLDANARGLELRSHLVA